jgi:hypothetical protein
MTLVDTQQGNLFDQAERGAAPALVIRGCSKQQADAFLRKYHYMGGVSQGRYYGFFDATGNETVGVAVFSGVSSRFVRKNLFGSDDWRVLELSRLACKPEFKPLSAMLALAVKQLRRERYDAILSYADVGQGHLGIIYQASNFTYTGEMPSAGHPRYFIGGKEISPRKFYNQYGTAAHAVVMERNKHMGIVAIKRTGKHRYCLPLNRKAKAALLIDLPYPKVKPVKQELEPMYADD